MPGSIREEVDISTANDNGLDTFFGGHKTSEVTTEVTEADLDDVVFTDRLLRLELKM